MLDLVENPEYRFSNDVAQVWNDLGLGPTSPKGPNILACATDEFQKNLEKYDILKKNA